MEKLLLVSVLGFLGGWFFERNSLPGGAIVGSMLATGLTAMSFQYAIQLPPLAGTSIQIILGISLGLTFDRSFVPIAIRMLPLAIISTLVLLTIAVIMAFVADKLGIVDFATAVFGFSPGGMSGMSVLAQVEGHKTPVVAFLHVVRVLTLFIVVPYLGRAFVTLINKL